jgi:hypothetical protein
MDLYATDATAFKLHNVLKPTSVAAARSMLVTLCLNLNAFLSCTKDASFGFADTWCLLLAAA